MIALNARNSVMHFNVAYQITSNKIDLWCANDVSLSDPGPKGNFAILICWLLRHISQSINLLDPQLFDFLSIAMNYYHEIQSSHLDVSLWEEQNKKKEKKRYLEEHKLRRADQCSCNNFNRDFFSSFFSIHVAFCWACAL